MSGYAFLLVVNTAKMSLYQSKQAKTIAHGIDLQTLICIACWMGTEEFSVAEWPLHSLKRPSASYQRRAELHQRR